MTAAAIIYILVFTLVFIASLLCFYAATRLMAARQRRFLKAAFGVEEGPGRDLAFTKEVLNAGQHLPHKKGFSLATLNYLLIVAQIPFSPERFILAVVFGGGGAAVLVWAVLKNSLAAAGVFGFCLAAPAAALYLKKKQLEQQLTVQMPDALGMIVRALRVGQSVDNSLKDVAGAVPPPLGTEIRIIYEEVRMGIPFDQALRNFENRYPALADAKIFTTAFIIQREIGGSLSQILEGLGETIKKRFYFQRQVKTFSAEARISAVIIGLLPLLFVAVSYLFNPGYITRLTDTSLGRILVCAAFVLEAAGFLVMRKMARIKI